MAAERYLTVQELADRLNVSLNTAKALPIAYTRVGKRQQRRYRRDMVERYEILNASQPLAWKAALSA